jgi:hypothetical protein
MASGTAKALVFAGARLRALGAGFFAALARVAFLRGAMMFLQIDNDEGGMMFRRPWVEACAVKAANANWA